MANKIILKKSSVTTKVPLETDLVYGELALNYADEKLYFKNAANAIKSFNVTGAAPSALTIGTGLSGGSYDGSAPVTIAIDSSVVTLNGVQSLTNKTFTDGLVISTNTSTNALRITQVGTGNALIVEDEANPDSTPFVIDASGNVGIGTSAPTDKLHTDSGNVRFSNGNVYIEANSDDVNGKIFTLNKSRGTFSAKTSVVNGDHIGSIYGGGYQTTSYRDRAEIGFYVDGEVVGNAVPTAILFRTGTTSRQERLRITSVGNVGIGTTAPTAKLDIFGNSLHLTETSANLDTFKVLVDSGGAGYSHTYLKGQALTLATYANPQASNYTVNSNVYSAQSSGVISSGALVLGAGTAERMRLDSAGNLGLGVTPSAWGTTFKIAQVGTGSIFATTTNNNASFGSNVYVDSAVAVRYIATAPATRYLQLNGTHRFYSAPSGTAGDVATLTETVIINASGNVGIGTTAPTAKLDVVGGQLRISSSGTYSEPTAIAGVIAFDTVNGQLAISARSNGGNTYTSFYTSNAGTGAERLSITSTGNVGIGITAPATLLDVRGNSGVASGGSTPVAIRIGATDQDGGSNTWNTSADFAQLQFHSADGSVSGGNNIRYTVGAVMEGVAGGTTALAFRSSSSGVLTERMRITSDGKVIIGHTSDMGGGAGLQIKDQNNSMFTYSNNAFVNGVVNFYKSRSTTPGSFTAVQSGDELGFVFFRGDNGSSFNTAAYIGANVDGTPGTGDMPGRLVFATTADGASTPTERMRINSLGAITTPDTGRVQIGSGAEASSALVISRPMTGNVVVWNTYTTSSVQSDVTSQARIYVSNPTTQATTFTLPTLVGFSAQQQAFGAGSTVTNQFGFEAAASLTGATNNFGFRSNIASGTGRWNFYANGTAANVFAGQTSIGGLLGAESLRVTPVTSAVNYLEAQGQITTGGPSLIAAGSDTNIDLLLKSKGTGAINAYTNSSVLQFRIAHTASAVNYLQATGSSSVYPSLSAQGSGTNVGVSISSKGSEGVYLQSGFTTQLAVTHTASAVNYLQVTGSATGNGVTLSSQGSDTNINLILTPKGTGNVGIGTTSPTVKLTVGAYANAGTNGTAGIYGSNLAAANTAGILTIGATDALAADVGGSVGFTANAGTISGYPTGSIAGRRENATSANYASYMQFTTSNSLGGVAEKMRLDSAGNLGLGVTPSAWATYKVLQVANGSVANISNAATVFAHNWFWNGTANTYINDGFATSYIQGTGLHRWTSASSGTAGTAATMTERMRLDASGNLGIGTTAPAYKLEVNGSFAATTKSFVIPHPTKLNMKLRYGSLEGPENGVYVRGKLVGNTIELPEYWTKLVDPDSITVTLTPIGRHQKLYVEDIINNTIIVGNESDGEVKCFYVVYGERCDVDKLEVEID